jgi:hypothetical protein
MPEGVRASFLTLMFFEKKMTSLPFIEFLLNFYDKRALYFLNTFGVYSV